MGTSATTWMKYPMKTSKIIVGLWKKMWNIRIDEIDKISILLSCIRQHTPYLGWSGDGDYTYYVNHDGRGIIATGKTLKRIIPQLEKQGIIIDDLKLSNKFKFKLK